MEDKYGSDYITIADDDGNEYELEVLNTIEYNGYSYLAVIPADADDQPDSLQIGIIKSVDEDGEIILYTVDDEDEWNAVNNLIIDAIYPDQLHD